jgi:3-polyprenyl-4-hydroxybenzoate decarboxylase
MAFESFRDWLNPSDSTGGLKRSPQSVATELEITEPAGREMKSHNKEAPLDFKEARGLASHFSLIFRSRKAARKILLSDAPGSARKLSAHPIC